MHKNEELIHRFYKAFQVKDYKTMQQCYSDQSLFNDEVFADLDARKVRKMWEMLIKRSTDLKIEYGNVQSEDNHGSAEWTAYYTFSQTGKKVTNKIKSSFEFENGKIVKHTDRFPFYSWSSQAFGITGRLLGWTSFLKNKVRKNALHSLNRYISKNPDLE